jgi:hypothetical protein
MNLRSLAKGTVEEGTTILGFLASSAIADSQSISTCGITIGTPKKTPIGQIKIFGLITYRIEPGQPLALPFQRL